MRRAALYDRRFSEPRPPSILVRSRTQRIVYLTWPPIIHARIQAFAPARWFGRVLRTQPVQRLGMLGGLLVLLLGIVGLMLLHGYADTHRQTETALARIEALTHELVLTHQQAALQPERADDLLAQADAIDTNLN